MPKERSSTGPDGGLGGTPASVDAMGGADCRLLAAKGVPRSASPLIAKGGDIRGGNADSGGSGEIAGWVSGGGAPGGLAKELGRPDAAKSGSVGSENDASAGDAVDTLGKGWAGTVGEAAKASGV